MILTNEIASKNVGKYIDLYSRMGNYPKKIIQFPNGDFGLMCIPSKVCMRIDEESRFNATHYDYIFTPNEPLKELE